MDPNIEELARFFDESWQPMLGLMARARAIEFRIRLAAEVHSQASFSNSRTWDEFQKGPRAVVRQKLERHIRALFPSISDQMILIRQCADALAHADYRAARIRIDQYKKRFDLTAKLTASDVGLMLYRNVRHQDGSVCDLAYFVNSSEDNLILEEYEVFEKQGYVGAAEELMGTAEAQLATISPRLNLKYAALVMSRGLKYGRRSDA